MRTRTLKLLPGLRWSGKLDVICRLADGRYIVQFDARNERSREERYVYDRTELTADQIERWTGAALGEGVNDG